jgi:Ca2+-transporting ATPase
MITSKVKVIRNNQTTLIDSSELTIGDIIIFEAGDNIYADARIIEANGLKLLESTLTGESVSVDKSEKNIFNDKTPLGDRDNMVYSGCTVVYGSGKAVVTNVGMQTEIGKIATMIKDATSAMMRYRGNPIDDDESDDYDDF